MAKSNVRAQSDQLFDLQVQGDKYARRSTPTCAYAGRAAGEARVEPEHLQEEPTSAARDPAPDTGELPRVHAGHGRTRPHPRENERVHAELYRKQVLEQDPMDLSDDFVRGNLKFEDELQLKPNLKRLDMNLMEDKQSVESISDRLQEFDRTFTALQQQMAVDDYYDLAAAYAKMEEENFPLFRYVQSINNEIEQLEDEKHTIERDTQNYFTEVLLSTNKKDCNAYARKRMIDDLVDVREFVDWHECVLLKDALGKHLHVGCREVMALPPAKMEMEELPPSRWACVSPCLAVLRSHADVSLSNDRNGASVVSVHIITRKQEDAWEERLEQCRDAMELLAIVQVVDFSAWSELMTTMLGCKSVPRHNDRLQDSASPRYALTLHRDDEDEARINDFVRFSLFFGLARPRAHEKSDELQRARQKVIDQCSPDMLLQLRRHTHFPVDVTFNPPHGQRAAFMECYLEDVLDLVTIMTERALATQQATKNKYRVTGGGGVELARDGVPFELRYVKLDLTEIALPYEKSSLFALADIAALGVSLEPGIDVDHEHGLGSLTVKELGPIVLAMTNHARFNEGCMPLPRLQAPESKLRFGEVNYRVTYDYDQDSRYLDPDNYKCEAICSALFTSQDVDHVHLKRCFSSGSRDEKWRKWQWLAFTLLSNESTSTVSTLAIEDYGFGQEDMAAISSILEATNPAMKLLSKQITGPHYYDEYGDEHTSYAVADDITDEELGNAGSVCVPAEIFVKINPDHSDPEKRSLLKLEDDSTFRVIKKDDISRPVVDCLIPGYGHCSVVREAITRFEIKETLNEAPTSLAQGYNGHLSKLQLCFEFPTDATTMVPLIEYLGPKLEFLDLQGRVYMRRATLRVVLAACPNLKKIFLANAETGVEIDILNAYEQNNCALSEFAILQMVPTWETIALARALQDPRSVISSRLQALALFTKHGDNLDEAILSAFLEVLRINKTLETLLLKTHSSKAQQEEFHKFNHELLPTSTSLLVEAKLAFLSVLKHHNGDVQAEVAGLTSLDQDVVSLVFEFAAERKIRSVNIRS